jgi:[ribosomal protein S5]-alanine N-acetyltransferase
VPSIPLPEPALADAEVRLRPWTLGDVPAVTAACRDPEISRWTVVPDEYTDQHATEFIATREADRLAGRELALAIVDHDDALLGAIGMSNFDWHDHRGEIGYWMARETRGRGFGTRGVRLLSRWAIDALALERVELLANPANEASQRLAERAGFTREGLLRRYRTRRGVREDLVMFSLLPEDL